MDICTDSYMNKNILHVLIHINWGKSDRKIMGFTQITEANVTL